MSGPYQISVLGPPEGPAPGEFQMPGATGAPDDTKFFGWTADPQIQGLATGGLVLPYPTHTGTVDVTLEANDPITWRANAYALQGVECETICGEILSGVTAGGLVLNAAQIAQVVKK